MGKARTGQALAKKRARMSDSTKAPAPKHASAGAYASKQYKLTTCEGSVENVSYHATALDAATHAWAWSEDAGLCVVSGDWMVRTPKYGWQDAYNLMVPAGDDWEPSKIFLRFACRSLRTSRFEADGEGSRIVIDQVV